MNLRIETSSHSLRQSFCISLKARYWGNLEMPALSLCVFFPAYVGLGLLQLCQFVIFHAF